MRISPILCLFCAVPISMQASQTEKLEGYDRARSADERNGGYAAFTPQQPQAPERRRKTTARQPAGAQPPGGGKSK